MKTNSPAFLSIQLLFLGLIPFALNAQTAHPGASISLGNGWYGPSGVAVDGKGNVFVTDTLSNAVKQLVTVNGAVPANPQFVNLPGNYNNPAGVAVDAKGNVLVADQRNGVLKEIVASNGSVSATSSVVSLPYSFTLPTGVAVDGSGNVFVTDLGTGVVSEILAVNGAVTANSIIISVASGFSAPNDVAVDGSGNVFVANLGFLANSSDETVKEIVAVNGSVSAASQVITVGGTNRHPYGPAGIGLDGAGNLYIADVYGAVDKVVAVNGSVSATSSVITVAASYSPSDVAVDSNGNIFWTDGSASFSALWEKVTGKQTFPATSVGAASNALPIYFTFDSAGSLATTPYVVLTQGAQNLDFKAATTQPANACVTGHNYSVGDVCAVNVSFTPTKPFQRIGALQLMGSAGTPIATFNLVGTGVGPQVNFSSNSASTTIGSGFSSPYGVAVDGGGNVFVADSDKNAVYKIVAVNGAVSASSTVVTVGSGFSGPRGVAVDGSGNVFVADYGHGAVKEIVAVNGAVSDSSTVIAVGNGFSNPSGVAVDGSGNVFVADFTQRAVKEIVAVNGAVSDSSTVIAVGSGFVDPGGVAVDGSGNVFVSDYGQGAVKEIVAVNGAVSAGSTVISVGSVFEYPGGVAVDGSGNVFVADQGTHAVKEIVAVNGVVSASSTVITVGSGFKVAQGVAVDGSGNVFAADSLNDVVEEIDRRDPPSLTFPDTNVGSQSVAQSVTIQNIGNADLISTALAIGTNFAQVSGSGTPADCTATSTLAAGASCNFSISFQPTTSGPLQGSAALTNNSLNVTPSTQTIPLSGTGVATVQVTVGAGSESFSVDGTTYTSAKTFTWVVGSSHTIATASPQAGATGTQYVFTGWSDNGNASHSVTANTTTTSYIASFKTQYLLTTAANPSAGGTVTSGGYFDANSQVALQAAPNNTYVFTNWSGSVANANSVQTTVTMTGPMTVTANFNNIVNVTVGTNIPGLSFSVDGTSYTTPQAFQWVNGESHSLATASPQTASGGVQYSFSQWSDGGAISHTVTASLSTPSYGATFQTTATPMLTGAPTSATIRNDFPGFVGMKFTTGASPINVLSLGRIYLNGNSQTHIVKLVDAYSGLDVPNASVSLTMTSGTANTYQYAPLSTTVILSPNTSYYLLTQEFVGGDKWYDFAPVTANSSFTVNGAVYQASVGSYILYAPGAFSYVPPNMQFVGGTIIPPPVVNMTSPANGAAVQGTISLTATATAAPGLTITTVQFRLNGSNFGAPLITSPYTLPLDTTTLLTAMNTVTAVATDSNGGTTTAAPVSFTVANSPSAPGPFLTGTPGGALRNDYSGFVGLKFTVGATALSVSQLGRWVVPGNSGIHAVKLVNADGTDVIGGSVSLSLAGAATGQYAYAPLGSPVRLAANTTYFLVTQESAGGDRWYDFNPVTANSAAGTVNSALYQQSNGGYTAINAGSNSYVPPNFLFTPSGGVSSAPPTVVITAPPSGSTVSGTVQLSAAATPANGLTITGVQFRINGANVGPVLTGTGPYNYSLDTTTLGNATDNLTAVATDSAGHTGASQTVVLTINNPIAPPPAGAAFLSSAPSTTTTLRNDYQGYVGLKFTVSATPLVVSQLGRWTVRGNNASHIVKLVQANGTDVPAGAVSINTAGATAGQYTYAALTSPVTLLANTSYFLMTQEFAGGDQWYDYSPVTASSGTVNAPAYQQANGAYVTLSPGSSSYGPPNFLYSAGNTPPAQPPPTVTITSPAAGPVTGTITLSATATPSDSLTIVKLQFQLNGSNVSSPLDTTTLTNGQYTLTALATDSAGSVGTSPGVVVTVNNPAAPNLPLVTAYNLNSRPLRNDYAGFVGMALTVGANNLPISSLGRLCVAGNSQTHTVELVNATTGAVVGAASVNMAGCTPGNFVYIQLTSTVTLTAATSYYLASQETSGGDMWYDHGTLTTASGAQVTSSAYLYNGAWQLIDAPNTSYVPVNFLIGQGNGMPANTP